MDGKFLTRIAPRTCLSYDRRLDLGLRVAGGERIVGREMPLHVVWTQEGRSGRTVTILDLARAGVVIGTRRTGSPQWGQ